MGASESKLVFKQGIFKLSEEKEIPADDPYWTGFWELPESSEDVFSLFAPVDIRRIRDTSLPNLETLILAVTSRVIILKNHPSFPDPELAPEKDALNCIRILTRILPFIYEAEHLEEWEERFFWGKRRKKSRKAQIAAEVLFDEAHGDTGHTPKPESGDYEEVKPLAEELLDALVDLLFFTGFTIPRLPTSKSKVTYAIWQSGVGCNTAIGSTKEFESHRCEILRLLLTITSKSMYMSSTLLPVKGVKAITYLATCPDKQIVLSVLCSLLNTVVKYNPSNWRVPYDHIVWKDPKQSLVVYSLQLLLVLLLYSIPEDGTGPPPKNYFRHYLGRLHRPQDFQFITEGMMRILSQPMQTTSSYLPGSQKPVKWAPEMIMLFWETVQCNKRFRNFLIDSNRAHDFVVIFVFYAIEYKTEASKQGIVRMCVFLLQTLSVEPNFGKNLNKTFAAQETLPPSIRITNFSGTYADFLVTSIHTLLTTSKGKLDAIYPALLAILNNISAYIDNLGPSTSSKLVQLFVSMSSPSFLLANETNHALLQSILEVINSILEHQYNKNANTTYAVLRAGKQFEALRAFTLESGQAEIERLEQRRKEMLSAGQESSSPSLTSPDDLHSPTFARTPTTLSHIPETDGTFTIGDSDDSDDETSLRPTPSQSSTSGANDSASHSRSSSLDNPSAVPLQLRGMSEKARGKMPAGQPSFSRQNSSTSLHSRIPIIHSTSTSFTPSAAWLESWLPDLPLHTTLSIVRSDLATHLPPQGSPHTSTLAFLDLAAKTPPPPSIEPSPIRVHLFEWSPLSLGWYESLLWSFIFAAEMVPSGDGTGAVGVWNGTHIKLFKVQEGASQGPTLLQPKGAVDAVGRNLVGRIGSLNLRGSSTGGGSSTTTSRNIREV